MSIDHRKEQRHLRAEKIFVEILSASEDDRDGSVMLECTTQDISVGGLKIQSKYPLVINAILELLISFESGGYKFLLTGQVKWFEQTGVDSYLAGFELIDAEHSDYVVWQKMFDEAETETER